MVVGFVWLFSLWATVAYLPMALATLWVVGGGTWPHSLLFMAGAGVLHSLYYCTLLRGYQEAHLSVVYPLARGLGALMATAMATAFIGERPGFENLLGALMVLSGAVLVSGWSAARQNPVDRPGVLFGLAIACLIGTYTVWDKYAVGVLLTPPLLQNYAADVGRVLLLTPLALVSRKKVISEWRSHRREVLAVGLLSPLAYILVLMAMSMAPVSYVAPAREIGIVFGVLLGAKGLEEGRTISKLAGSALMVAGIAVLSAR